MILGSLMVSIIILMDITDLMDAIISHMFTLKGKELIASLRLIRQSLLRVL